MSQHLILTNSSFCLGNDIYAAVLAVVAANIVLVSYIIVAALEERKATPVTKPEETKKEK